MLGSLQSWGTSKRGVAEVGEMLEILLPDSWRRSYQIRITFMGSKSPLGVEAIWIMGSIIISHRDSADILSQYICQSVWVLFPCPSTATLIVAWSGAGRTIESRYAGSKSTQHGGKSSREAQNSCRASRSIVIRSDLSKMFLMEKGEIKVPYAFHPPLSTPWLSFLLICFWQPPLVVQPTYLLPIWIPTFPPSSIHNHNFPWLYAPLNTLPFSTYYHLGLLQPWSLGDEGYCKG